jgi:hypothetical protein
MSKMNPTLTGSKGPGFLHCIKNRVTPLKDGTRLNTLGLIPGFVDGKKVFWTFYETVNPKGGTVQWMGSETGVELQAFFWWC